MINTSNFNYNGKLAVKLKLKDKIYNINTHNNGFQDLFYFLTHALAGNLLKSYLPSTVALYMSKEDGELEPESPLDLRSKYEFKLNNSIPITARTVIPPGGYPDDESFDEVRNSYSTSITATIPYSTNIEKIIGQGNLYSNRTFLIVLNSTSAPLAFFKIDFEILAQLTEGTQILIDWFLYFKNEDTETSEGDIIDG